MGSPLVEHVASLWASNVETAATIVFAQASSVPGGLWWVLGLVVLVLLSTELAGLRYIANNRVGILEKLWSLKGSVPEGRIIALDGEAGFQAEVLRGGLHFGLWRWQYRIHKLPLVAIPQGKIGYVYARDGEALAPSQTLGQVIACNQFQDARRFLGGVGGEPRAGTGDRPAGPAAGDPAGRCLRDQPGAVHGDRRGHGLSAGDGGIARSSRRWSAGRTS